MTETTAATTKARAGFLCMDGWSGREEVPVEVVGETPKHYKIKLLANCRLPGRLRTGAAGDTVRVPKHAVRIDKP